MFALEQQTTSTNRILQFYGKIGYGRCGHVFGLDGTGEVAKVAVDHDGFEVYNEFYMQQKIRESLQEFSQQISLCNVPTLRQYIAVTDARWWEDHGPRFPEEHRQPRSVLISERILPLSKIVQYALIDKYCPDGRKEAAIVDPINRDCLARVYLGELRNNRPYMGFNLRNFPFYLDQIVGLELSSNDIASTIASTLAVIHFKAEIDARDVEFALGTALSFSHNQALTSAEILTGSSRMSSAPVGTGINFTN